jgi:hypothetical protein
MLTEKARHKPNARKIGIDQERATFGLELVAVRAEVCDANATMRNVRLFRIGCDKIGVSLQTCVSDVNCENETK